LLFVLIAGYLWKEQRKQVVKAQRGSTSNVGKKVSGSFHAFIVKEGFKFWVVG
jgi:hypothetical protein